MSSGGVAMALGGGAGEAIPREYHRRVLKKIAQLTKVVYALNTRNEDHDSLIAALRQTYEERARQAEIRAAARLREMGERVKGACEEGERTVGEIRERFEEERERLKQAQASYESEAEKRLGAVQQEHRERVASLTRELERVSSEQAGHIKDIVQLREQVKAKLEQREKELTSRHEREMRAAVEEGRKDVERCKTEAAMAKIAMEREMDGLKERHRAEMETLRHSLRGEEEEKGAAEARRWEEKERELREELKQQEQSLARRVSGLSEELRTARDQLAVERQRITEMSGELEAGQSESRGLWGQLEEARRERDRQREKVESLQASLQTTEEEERSWREKLAGQEKAAVRLAVEHRQAVAELRSQLLAVQERLREVEAAREALASQHHSSSQQHSHTLTSLEKELLKLQRERDDLHSQYAREIEAAHAHSGAREVELSSQHSAQLQEMRQQRERALLELQTDGQRSLEQLRCDLSSEAKRERELLCSKHQQEVDRLKREAGEREARLEKELGEREARLERLVSELGETRAAVEERGRGLGEVEGEVGKLRGEMREMREKERAARREAEQLKEALEKLKKEKAELLERVVREKTESEERHRRELAELRSSVHRETQAECRESTRQEVEALRRELSEAHTASSQRALAALAQERDAAITETRQAWDRERSSLRETIVSLEWKLVEVQQASSLALEEGRKQAKEQTAELRESLECERRTCAERIEELRRAHHEEVERVRREEGERGRGEVEQVKEQRQRDTREREARHREAVRVAREEGERGKKKAVKREQDRHQEEIASLQRAVSEQHSSEVERLQGEWGREREAWARERLQLDSQREKEVSVCMRQLEEAREEVERRSHDLNRTRDSLDSITVETTQLRKQLGVRVQELESAKRQASNILRCREQELSSAHHAELEALASQYRQQTQLLLNDFNKAKQMMTTKIAQLQRQASELDSLYRSRDPRPEDVETIRELQRAVKHQQTRLREMEAEKRVYQLELVNREKNYNQIFSATPHVGVLDPLSGKKKTPKAESLSSGRHSSAPSLSVEWTRLPTLVDSAGLGSRLTASDAELGRQSRSGSSSGNGGAVRLARPHPHHHQAVTQSNLTKRKLTTNRDREH